MPYALWGAPALVFGLLGRNPLANGAVELGLVCFALLALALALVRDPEALPLRLLAAPPVLLAAALAVLIGLRLSASDATRFELRRFLAEGLLFLAGGIAIGRRRRGLDLWALVLAATATASALVVTAGLAFDNDRWSDGALPLYAEGTPRALARDTAPALLAAAYVALSTRHERVRLTALTALPVLLIAYAASPDRGPLLGLAVGLLVLLALMVGRRVRMALLLGVAPLLAAAIPVAQLVSGGRASRLLGILVGVNGSAQTRYDDWSLAWHTFVRHPLAGTGSAGAGAGDVFLAASSELGIAGLLIVVAFVVSLAVTLARARRAAPTHLALAWALAVAALLDATVAGGLATSPYLWLAAGLSVGLAGDAALARAWLIRRTRGEMLAPVPSDEPAPAPPPAVPVALGLSLDDVDAVVGGTIVLQVRADEHAVLRWVEYQISPAGRHEWRSLARVDRPPFALELDTTLLGNGLYDFRGLGADPGGRVELSRPARARRVENATREIAVAAPAPGSWVRDEVELRARASDGAPVVFEISRDGVAWQPLPSDAWNTMGGPDGEFLLRALAADGRGTSEAIAVAVDNTPPAVRLVRAVELAGRPAAVRIGAVADDAGSGVIAVRFDGSYDGAVWDPLATVAAPPYEIDLETEALSAPYLVRCVARDGVGNEAATEALRVPPAATAAPPSALRLDRGTIWDLERLLAARPAGPEREEQEALLYSLRPYANVDGTIPSEFWELVRGTFGDLVA